MVQIFPKWSNWTPVVLAIGVPIGLIFAVAFVWYYWSPKYTDVGYRPKQPVPFSHKMHAGDLGMDCRYCHNTVERGAYAAIPPSATCMNCHKSVLPESQKLAKIRSSFENGEPVEWTRVHMLPDYAYFNHSAHLARGIGCVTCHGRIDRMDVVHQEKPLSMKWCLNCHRNPEPNLRPVSEITNMEWDKGDSEFDPKPVLKKLHPPTYCSGCHR